MGNFSASPGITFHLPSKQIRQLSSWSKSKLTRARRSAMVPLGDMSRRRCLFSRGREVTTREVPERRRLSFERVRRMTVGQLTRAVAQTSNPNELGVASTKGSEDLLEEEEELWR
jgi:hypothetical protein